VLKAAKPHLEERLAMFREDLKVHQEKVEKELQVQLARLMQRFDEFAHGCAGFG
jgi:superfamily II RNA helicase